MEIKKCKSTKLFWKKYFLDQICLMGFYKVEINLDCSVSATKQGVKTKEQYYLNFSDIFQYSCNIPIRL